MNREPRDHETTFLPAEEVMPSDVPAGVDRRTFMMRSAVAGAAAVIAGCAPPAKEQAAAPAEAPAAPTAAAQMSPDLDVVKKSKGPVMTTIDEFYKVGGFIEWKGYEPPKKEQPKYPYSTMKELLAHAQRDGLSVAQVAMANEVAVSGKSEAEVNAFIDKVTTAMVNIVKTGLSMPVSVLPGPIKLKTKAGEVYKRAMDDKYEKQRGVGVVAAYALAGSEENARGHLVVTAPTGGSAGVMPALVYSVGEGGRNLPQEKIRAGMLAAAVIGYLCKRNATLAGAEGGCQAEIGVASAMARLSWRRRTISSRRSWPTRRNRRSRITSA